MAIRKVTIKDMKLENYKGVEDFFAEFYQNTEISGKNGVGKSTIKDAYFDIMTNKMADGTSTDNIRPKDSDGKEVDHIEIKRMVTTDSNELGKFTNQKWVKPRGAIEEVLKGNETTYSIDGFDKKAKDFDEFLADICEPETMLMCSNPTAFIKKMQKSTVEARQLLEKLSGFDLEAFVKKNTQYKEIYDALKGHSIEEFLKQMNKNLRQQNKSKDEARTRLQYEKERVVQDDSDEYKSRLVTIEDTLDRYAKEIVELDDSIADENTLRQNIMDLKMNASEIETAANKNLIDAKVKIKAEMDEVASERNQITVDSTRYDSARNNIKFKIESLKKDLEQIGHDYKTLQASKMDERRKTCPTCGRKHDAKSIEKMMATFEKDKKAKMDFLSKRGNDVKAEIIKLQEEFKNIPTVDVERQNYLTERITALELRYKALPESVDMSQNTDYIRTKGLIFDFEKSLEEINECKVKKANLLKLQREMLVQKNECETGIAVIKSKIEEHEKRIENLEIALRCEVQKCADIEKLVDEAKAFAFDKNSALSEKVNNNFKFIKFQFVDVTLEGNPYETLRIIVDGIDYMNGLNESSKKLAEVDLCVGLQKMNDLCLPIWLDEASIIDDNRIPWNIEQQLICIRRTDDSEIKVREVKA